MKKFIKKLTKKTEGFTLVELIVVIAILGILAGVAVPAYSGYLTKAKDAADIVTLDAIKTAAQAYKAANNAGDDVEKVEVDTNSGKVSAIKVDNADVSTKTDFLLFLTGATDGALNSFELEGSYKGGAIWTTDNGWVAG